MRWKSTKRWLSRSFLRLDFRRPDILLTVFFGLHFSPEILHLNVLCPAGVALTLFIFWETRRSCVAHGRGIDVKSSFKKTNFKFLITAFSVKESRVPGLSLGCLFLHLSLRLPNLTTDDAIASCKSLKRLHWPGGARAALMGGYQQSAHEKWANRLRL